ncbi:RadC family protein [Orrella sp. 11846]|uniref:RadC family protein n=1 Tax=Orrella sp. 11846 TaxID=3409913 RepID=UPI003B5C4405
MALSENLPSETRPRERLLKFGAQALTDAELLALLLGTGITGKSVFMLAQEILQTSQGVAGLPRLKTDQLCTKPGIGVAKACLLVAAFELGRRASLASLQRGEPLTSPAMVRDFCRTAMSHLDIEHCQMIMLDAMGHVLGQQTVSKGTLYETPIYPREVARIALASNAASVILIHNHPSGNPSPSPADIQLTHELAQILMGLDIALLDHLIVAGPEVTSLAELGHLRLYEAA